MLIDAQNQFSDAQAVTVDAVGDNVIDLGVDRSIGVGEPMAVVFTVDVAADQADGDEDYEFEVEYASNAAQSAGRKQVGSLIFESGTPDAPALNADLLVAGFQFAIPIPPAKKSMSERYLGIRYDTTGTSPSITVTAMLMPMSMIQQDDLYPDNITIS